MKSCHWPHNCNLNRFSSNGFWIFSSSFCAAIRSRWASTSCFPSCLISLPFTFKISPFSLYNLWTSTNVCSIKIPHASLVKSKRVFFVNCLYRTFKSCQTGGGRRLIFYSICANVSKHFDSKQQWTFPLSVSVVKTTRWFVRQIRVVVTSSSSV